MVPEEKKLILIRLDANHEKGMGHLFRMLTLANQFRKENIECIFIVRDNAVSAKILQKHPFRFLFYPEVYPENSIIEEYFKRHTKPDLWIFDILATEKTWILQVQKKGIPVICFDDVKGGPLAADLVINAIAGCWYEIPDSLQVVNGPQYAIIDPGIADISKKKLPIEGAIKVGVTLGGSDTHGATVQIAQALSEVPGIDVTFFLGPHFLHNEELNLLLSKTSYHYVVKRAVPDLNKELVVMDTVICSGGQTLFELCAMGMPVLALATESHEEKTISYFTQQQACIDIGSVKKPIDVIKIREFFLVLREGSEEVVTLQVNTQNLVDGKGIYRIIRECRNIMMLKNNR